MEMMNKINYVMSNEDAFSVTEFVLWTAVVLALIIPLFIFRDTIEEFFSSSIRRVGNKGPKY